MTEIAKEIQWQAGNAQARARGPAAAFGERRAVRTVGRLLAGLMALASLALLAYTPVCEHFHARRMAGLIAAYEEAVAALPEGERTAMLEAARAYNRQLSAGTHFALTPEEQQAYTAQLDPGGTGMMGYLQIPEIGVSLPIYHTADADVLAQAAGHLPGSSLPVGGTACHTVLCGHRARADAYLFRDLGRLEIGDTFTLTVLGETITYEVDRIKVVLPQEIGGLAIEPGKDYCTLVTCHPWGSESHRLLVSGRRADTGTAGH